MKKYTLLVVLLLIFYGLAVALWQLTNEIFYLYNFLIIGTALGAGVGLWPVLPKHKKHIARLVSQLLVGGYMFFGLGCGFIYLMFGYVMPENMQIEGFWFWVLSGLFMAAVMHYLIAKIIGPLIFNRAWCGWACWTAAALDLLPWRYSRVKRDKRYRRLRYLHFAVSTAVVFTLFFAFGYGTDQTVAGVAVTPERPFVEALPIMAKIPELWWFLGGNALYYAAGILLAVRLKDNRAFCKYVCTIPVVMKPGARLSLLKVDSVKRGCTGCGVCEKLCPMDIAILEYADKGKRVLSSECIVCETCVNSCPEQVLKLSMRFSDRAKCGKRGSETS